MVAPPFDAGAANVIVAWPFPATAVGAGGASGLSAETKVLDGADGVPAPMALFATTVNVYGVPVTNPGTTIGLVLPVAVNPPGLEITV
jgi:hypothetical protein